MYKSIMGEQKPLKIFTKVKDSSFHGFETQNNLDPKVVTAEVHALVKCSLVQSSFLRLHDLYPAWHWQHLDFYLLVKVQAPTG